MKDKQHVHLFRAKVGAEKGWLIKSFNWTGVLEVRPSNLQLRVISNRANSVRVIALVLCSVVIPAVALLATWPLLNAYFSATLSGWQYFAWAIASIVLFLAFLWFLGIVGMAYLLDYLTLGIQARHSYDVALLRVTEASFGRLRHTLKVIVEKNLLSEKERLQLKVPFPEELLLTVAATRRGLRSAINPLVTTAGYQGRQ